MVFRVRMCCTGMHEACSRLKGSHASLLSVAMPAPPPKGGELINGRMPSFRNEYEVLYQRLHKYDINSNCYGTPCQHHTDTCAEHTCLSI